MLDVSAAGHLAGGETIDEGIREAREELGIDVDARDLLHIGERVEVADQDNGQHNREYQSVFLLQTDKELAAFRPQIEEVWGLFWIPITDGLALFAGRIDQLRVSGIEYDQEVRGYIGTERTVRPDDFLPRIQRYYMAALIAAQRAVDGKPDIAIS